MFQYKRDLNKELDHNQPETISEDQSEYAVGQTDQSGITDLISFSGECEFCHDKIKPFPSLHQQVISYAAWLAYGVGRGCAVSGGVSPG